VRVALRAKIDASNTAPFAASVTLSFASEDGTALPPDVTPQALVKGEGEWIRYLVDPSALDRASRILRNEGLDSESRNPLAFSRASHYNYRRGVPESVSIALHLLPVAASFDAKGKPISFVANGQPVVPELALSLARLPDRNKPIPVDVSCVIGGVKVDPFILDRAARHAYDHHSNLAFQLPDEGPWSVISFEALSRWVANASPIIRCLTVSGTKITINRRDAIGLAAARFDLPGPGGEELQKIIAGSLAAKLAFGPETVPCVDGVTFLPYQTQAASWLSYLRENSLSGLLADDRGMGKTLEVLSAIATRRNEIVDAGLEIERPIALIVVERKEIAHWANAHGDRYCKKLGIHLEHGPTQLRLVSELKRKAVILTTYNQVVRDPDRFHALAPEFVFFDEAKAMKNTSSKRWSCARDFKSSTLVPITGTPLDRNVGDIWSLFELACPGVLGDQPGFKALWSSLIGRRDEQAMSALRTIREKIAPFSLRRTKSDVRDQFKSEKRQSVEWLTLDDAEAKAYESIRARAEADKDTIFEQLPFHKAQIKVQGVIERVRRHVAKPGRPGELTTKGEHLVSMVSDLIEADHKVLVFSSFNDHCETISEIFNSSGIANAVYSGGNAKKRDRELSFFKDGHVPVLILSDLGSSGLDLPEADTVIIYDPWINLGKEDQKGDRAHRLVSSKDVSVFSLVTAGTIEAAGHAVLERSRSSGEAFFSDTAEGVESVALTIDDYDAMFASPRV
jgi:superfamily II DNA or RNA helicase